MIKCGLIGISNNKKGLFPRLIRFFTSSNYSHSFITLGQIQGSDSVIEATTLVQVIPFDRNYRNDLTQEYLLFETKASEDTINESVKICFNELSGESYGYLQLTWFVYRWFMKAVFNKDVSHEKNWFADGIICSELVYYFIHNLGDEYRQILDGFNPNTIQVQDILNIINKNPGLFSKIEV